MDQLYDDFTVNVLPKIQEGLVITKDYFFEFFGRYVKYLIITDVVWLVASFITFILFASIAIMCGKWASKADWEHGDKYVALTLVLGMVSLIGGIGSSLSIIHNTQNLIKSIYIPEVRIIEELNIIKGN